MAKYKSCWSIVDKKMLTIWLIEIKIIYSTVNLAKKILMKHEMSSFFFIKSLKCDVLDYT